MVTSNNIGPFNRFKGNNVVGESYVEKYIRARKRHTLSPVCLFGAPSQVESDQFLTEQSNGELVSSKRKLEKYDVSGATYNLLEESDNDENQLENVTEEKMTSSSVARQPSEFQPANLTKENLAPDGNLFSPMDKVKPGPSRADAKLENTDYWQTSKRRRSSGEDFVLENQEKRTSHGDSASQTGDDSSENVERNKEKY